MRLSCLIFPDIAKLNTPEMFCDYQITKLCVCVFLMSLKLEIQLEYHSI